MDKYEIAQVLKEIGLMVELLDLNPKKGLAYRRAAYSLESSPNLELLIETNALQTLPGIGKEISKMIPILFDDKKLPYYLYLKKQIPESLLDLTWISGLSISKIRTLYETLHISSLNDLKLALQENKLDKIKGFGPAFLKKLEKRLHELLIHGISLLYPRAESIAESIKEKFKKCTGVFQIAGELRRKLEKIQKLHFIATSKNPKETLFLFKNHYFVNDVIKEDKNFATVLLKHGCEASIQVVEEDEFFFSLLKATGNSQHLECLEIEAGKKGIVFSNEIIRAMHFESESEIYHFLDLNFIPPELREGFGEIDAAKTEDFSQLIEEKDLKGTFHCHTVDSDGINTIEEMVEGAQKLGWKYIGISDHSKSSPQAHGLSEERLINQIEKIKQLNEKFNGEFKVFSGIECDILPDGQLDFSNELLKKLDFVIVSVHSKFKQDKQTMTNRLIKAIENPYVSMIGHLTGRLLTYRDPYELDIPKVIDACIANHKIIEINATPSRLDMDWRLWIQAKGKGLKCSINPDAHSVKDFKNCNYGVNIARKGWLEKKDVINTLPLSEIEKFLKNQKKM